MEPEIYQSLNNLKKEIKKNSIHLHLNYQGEEFEYEGNSEIELNEINWDMFEEKYCEFILLKSIKKEWGFITKGFKAGTN